MNKTLLALGTLALSLGLIGSGATAAASVNVKANTANAATPANTAANTANAATPANTAANTASNTANTNSAANTAAPPATAGAAQNFRVVNKTGLVIINLNVSPSDNANWGVDILGRDILNNGESADINFDPTEKAAKWDLRIVDIKNNSHEWKDLDLTEISKLTLYYDEKTDTDSVDIEYKTATAEKE